MQFKTLFSMISSMTGFGRGSAQTSTKRVKVEIKSLNSKQLDLSLRVPAYFREMEVTMRNPIAAKLERGKVELAATVENLVAEPSTTGQYRPFGCIQAAA